MPNITVTVSESAYRAARIWAAEHDVSVSAVVQYCIERLPRLPIAQQAAKSLQSSKSDCEAKKKISSDPSKA